MASGDRSREPPEIVTTEEARSGENTGVYRILAVSLALAVVAALVIYFVFLPMMGS